MGVTYLTYFLFPKHSRAMRKSLIVCRALLTYLRFIISAGRVWPLPPLNFWRFEVGSLLLLQKTKKAKSLCSGFLQLSIRQFTQMI